MGATLTAAQVTSEKEHDRARFGLGLFLFSKTMFFSALVGAYIVLYKTHIDEWPPQGVPELQLGLSSVNTLLILLSCVPAFLAGRAIRRGSPGGARAGLGVTCLIGLVFIGIQLTEWRTLYQDGLTLQLTYGSCYYVLTAFHALYVLTGLVLLSYTLARSCLGHYTAKRHIGIDMAIIWWHFVSAVWLLLFCALYVLPKLE